VVGGAFWMGGRQPPKVDPTPPPPPVVVDNTPQPPAKPAKRGMTPEEGNTIQTLQNAKRFTEAEEFIKKKDEVWKEDTTASLRSNLLVARTQAANEELQNAQRLRAVGKFNDAMEAVDRAIAYAGETDATLFERIQTARRTGNCPGVLAYVEALAQQFPNSSQLKKANDYKRVCMSQPAIGAQELSRALKLRQADIESCLKTPIPAEHAGAVDIELAFTVNTTGVVTAASCLTPALAKESICQCLTEQVKQMHFTEKPGIHARRATAKFTPIQG